MGAGASAATAETAKNEGIFSSFTQSLSAIMASVWAPEGDPISTPIPRRKPGQPTQSAPEKPASGVIAQCGYATIVSELSEDGDAPIFKVLFSDGMVDEMVADGCGRFFQGCNVCNVRYDGCSAAEREACTDVACLEKTCERNVICSAKSCAAQGEPPKCTSRLARTSCLQDLFD